MAFELRQELSDDKAAIACIERELLAMASVIDLRCIICPKQPTFSDQSHLLTHIGSKGHLSHCFRAQVRGSKDAAERQRLLAYDEWYRMNGIATLLAQRMETKESKKQKAVQEGKVVRVKSEKPSMEQSDYKTQPYFESLHPALALHREYCIDPSLRGPGPYPAVSFSESHRWDEKGEWAMNESHPYAPTAQMYSQQGLSSAEPYGTQRTYQGHYGKISGSSYLREDRSDGLRYDVFGGENEAHEREYNNGGRWDRKNYSLSSSTSAASHSRQTSTTDSVPDPEGSTEGHRLKGTVWPGMDLFDTANEESKRRRNQKKDRRAIAQLAEDSKAVEQTEVIYFYPSWEVKKARFISGIVDSSPIRGSSPEAKNPAKKKRIPLDELEPNIPARLRKTRSGKQPSKAPKNAKPRKGKRAACVSDDEDIDLMQPLQPLKGPCKRAFKVFQDNPGDTNENSCDRDYQPTPLFETPKPKPLKRSGFMAPSTSKLPSIQSDSHKVYDIAHKNNNTFPVTPEMPPDLTYVPQLITPRRVLLGGESEYAGPSNGPSFLLGFSNNYRHQRAPEISPLGFSFSDLYAYHHEPTPKRSPLTTIQQRHSPSKRVPKAPQVEDFLGESSGDETIDLGIGPAENTQLFG